MNGAEPSDAGRPRGIIRRAKGVFGTRFVRETMVLQFGTIVQMATYLITSVVLARGLGPHEFGRYAIAWSLYVTVFFITNLGVTTATISEYATACGKRDHAAKVRALAAFVKVFLLMSALILALGMLLPACSGWWYDDAQLGWYAWALCLLGPIEMTNGFVLVVLQGSRRMVDFILFDNACGLVRLVIIAFALLGFAELEGVIAAYLISGGLYAIMAFLMYRGLVRDLPKEDAPPPLREIARALPSTPARALFSSGTLLALSKNGGQMIRNLAFLLTGNVAGTAALGSFRVAERLVWAIQQLLNGLYRSLLPALGFRLGGAKGDVRQFKRDLIKVGIGSGVLFIAVTAVICLLAPWLIRFLYGDAYASAVPYVWLLSIGHLMLGFAVVIDPFYIFTNQLAVGAKRYIVMFVMVLPLWWFLIRGWGAAGCAIFLSLLQLLMIVHVYFMWRWFRANPGRRPAAPIPAPEPGS